MRNVIITVIFAIIFAGLNSCQETDCFCDEDIVLYQSGFENQSDLIGWAHSEFIEIVDSKYENTGTKSMLIGNSGKSPRTSFEFIARNSGKAKLKFSAINYADNIECIFRNISKPQQIVIPISSMQFKEYDYTSLLEINQGDNITVEFYSASDADSLLLVDNMKIVMMK